MEVDDDDDDDDAINLVHNLLTTDNRNTNVLDESNDNNNGDNHKDSHNNTDNDNHHDDDDDDDDSDDDDGAKGVEFFYRENKKQLFVHKTYLNEMNLTMKMMTTSVKKLQLLQTLNRCMIVVTIIMIKRDQIILVLLQ